MSSTTRPAVVFLARGTDAGLPAATLFLESYARFDAGAAHDLIVVRKGFEDVAEQEAVGRLAVRHGAQVIDLPDDGFDWAAYFRAAGTLRHEWLLFINSHSRILAPHWLSDYLTAASRDGHGLFSATGSWQAHPMNPAIAVFFARYMALRRSRVHAIAEGLIHFSRVVRDRLRREFLPFPSFPNPHLRSNAFLIPREHLLAFADSCGSPRDKVDAFRLESGRRGLTRFMQRKGLHCAVVARGGRSFGPAQFPESGTYRVPDQPELLIGDNVTRHYEAHHGWDRLYLEVVTWGRGFTQVEPPPLTRHRA